MTVDEFIEQSAKTAREKGWWSDRSFAEFIALCHSELSEALEHSRKGKKTRDVWYYDLKPDGILVELADVWIRIADYVASKGCKDEFITALREKMAYNETRPYRHGKKY